jgi:hypothetical protein
MKRTDCFQSISVKVEQRDTLTVVKRYCLSLAPQDKL